MKDISTAFYLCSYSTPCLQLPDPMLLSRMLQRFQETVKMALWLGTQTCKICHSAYIPDYLVILLLGFFFSLLRKL